jgi:hypothetical protein
MCGLYVGSGTVNSEFQRRIAAARSPPIETTPEAKESDQSITHRAEQTVCRSGGMNAPPSAPDALDLLEPFGSTVTVEREHEIYRPEGPAEYCWHILSSCVRTVTLMEDGRRQVGEFLFACDIFGLGALPIHGVGAEAVTDVKLRRYPRRMVDALADSRARRSPARSDPEQRPPRRA